MTGAWLLQRGIVLMDVRERAVYYLNIKPRTKNQVAKYLKEKGYKEEDIESAVSELEEYGYIDDINFSRMYFEYGFEKGRGLLRIKRELSEKGVSSEDIQKAYDDLEFIPDPYESAIEIGKAIIKGIDLDSLDYKEKKKLQARIGRRLAARGFSSDVSYKVMNRLVK